MPEQNLYKYAYYVRTNIQGVQRYAEITKEKNIFREKNRKRDFVDEKGKWEHHKRSLFECRRKHNWHQLHFH